MKLYTTTEVAKFCQVAPRTVSKWCDSGRIEHVREANTNNRLMTKESIKKFMIENNFPVPDELRE